MPHWWYPFADERQELPPFVPYTSLIYWLGAINIVQITAFPLDAGLKIFKYTKPYFVSVILEAIFGILASYFLVLYYDLDWVMIGLAVTNVIMFVCVVGPCLRHLKNGAAGPAVAAKKCNNLHPQCGLLQFLIVCREPIQSMRCSPKSSRLAPSSWTIAVGYSPV